MIWHIISPRKGTVARGHITLNKMWQLFYHIIQFTVQNCTRRFLLHVYGMTCESSKYHPVRRQVICNNSKYYHVKWPIRRQNLQVMCKQTFGRQKFRRLYKNVTWWLLTIRKLWVGGGVATETCTPNPAGYTPEWWNKYYQNNVFQFARITLKH